MTTTTMHRPQPSRLPLLLLALLLAGALLLAAIEVRSRMHAVMKHGQEALAIRQACEEQGPDEVWRSLSWRDPDKYFRVCTLPDGKQGLQIIRCVKGAWREVTAFIPASKTTGVGTPERVYEYLSGKARPFQGRLSSVCQ